MNKFKAGDWVIHNEQFKKVKSCGGYAVIFDDLRESYCHQDRCTLWQPQEGEFVIPENFSQSSIDSFEVIKWKEGYTFKCEPFIGSLPTFIKSSNETDN